MTSMSAGGSAPGSNKAPSPARQRRHVRRRQLGIDHRHHDDRSRPPAVPHDGDHSRITGHRRLARSGASHRPNALGRQLPDSV